MNLVKIAITILLLFGPSFGLRQIPPRVQREKTVCHTTFKAAMHGVFYDEKGKLLRPVPLSDSSIVLDTQLYLARHKVKKGTKDKYENIWNSKLVKIRKLKERNGEDFHFWMTHRTAKEANERIIVDSIPENTRLVPISVSRSSDNYRNIYMEMERLNVGQTKPYSHYDREIVTDLFFSERRSPNAVPSFLTSDNGIIIPLCSLNPLCAALKEDKKLIRETFAEGFEVTVKDLLGTNRTIRVIPF